MKEVSRDERTVFVENKSHSLGYIFMSFALLFDILYRSMKLGQSSFDLLAIIVLGGIITTIYQVTNKILNRAWAKSILLAIFLSAFIGIMFHFLR